MEIEVYSRKAIEMMDMPEIPHLIISINCPDEPAANIRTNESTLGRVDLFFWDVDIVPGDPGTKTFIYKDMEVDVQNIYEGDLCQARDGVKVVDLVQAHPEAELILVHCTAGKSRSAGAAGALHKALNGDDSVIFDNKRFIPNMRVYRHVLNAWNDKQ